MQHIFQLLSAETLNNDVLLFLSEFVLLLELFKLSLLCLPIDTEASLRFLKHLQLLLIKTLQQPLSPFLHLNQPTLKPLPQIIILCSPDIRTVPNTMLDELFNLIYPLGLEHIFLYRFHGNHQTCDILNQDVVSCDQQLFLLQGLRLLHRWILLGR